MARVLVVDDSATIRRVVRRTLAQAGFDVSVASDGREGLELAQREVPDLVLVDFVMPQMNGLKFVQAMRRVSNLADIPVVLMSAKADKIGDGFLAQTGAVDAISKPFSPDALLTVTEHALAKTSDTEPPPAMMESVERISSVPPSGELPTETTPLVLADASAQIAARLAALVSGVMPDVDPEGLADAIEVRFEPSALFSAIEELAQLVPGRDGEIALRGRTEHVPLGEVLQLVTQSRQTGVLEVEKRGSRSGRAISVCLEDGRVQLALGRVHEQEFRLGRYLLREGLIEREDLDRILTNKTASQRGLLGARLVRLGYLSAEELHRALVLQTSELIYEALRWPRGDFRFVRFASRPEARDANLGLPLASILMEGLRRVDEWRLIEEQVGSFDAVPRRDEETLRSMDPERFDGDERSVLETIDGVRTVREIIDASQLSSFDACKILFQMATSRLVRI
ncbi:MAG: response regulator [Sandaracinaceae bacterium]|nr:response regulator [Sandaracinaceae bacterium]